MAEQAPIRLLGPVEVGPDGSAPGGPKRQVLFAVLALRAGRVVSTDHLAGVVWRGEPPSDPLHALQAQVSKLRKVLVAAGVDGGIDNRADGYVLEVRPQDVDVRRFERAAQEGIARRAADPARASELLAAALDLWRGPALGPLGDHPDLQADVTRLEQLRRRVRETRGQALLDAGDPDGAATQLHEVVADDPMRESAWSHLLLALYRSGRQAEALAAYARARDHLAEHLGVDPSPGLRDLHTRILQQDPSLDGAPGPVAASATPARSLAVLPFDVIGDSADATHLALGLHSDLLSELSRVPELTVISRTSVLDLGDLPLPETARRLGVGAVVEGTVQAAADHVRLRVRLVDARRDVQLWSHAYDGRLDPTTLFRLQGELARDLAAALSTELAPRPAPAADGARTGDLDAWRQVAVGRQHLDRKTEQGHQRAVEAFEEAARLDEAYVAAWTGLADALVSMGAYGHGDTDAQLPRAQRAVHRAISLDPHAADARAALGVLHVAYQDGSAAIAELEHAIRIQPGHAPAHNWLAWVTLLTGRLDRAAPLGARAVELDPLAAEAHAHMALVHLAQQRPQDGLQDARRARELSPYTTADLYEGMCLHELGRHAESRAVLAPLSLAERGALGVPWADAAPDAVLAMSLAASGDTAGARRVLADVEEVGDDLAAGLVLAALGEAGDATARLARVDHVGQWPCLAIHHTFSSVWAALEPEVRMRLAGVGPAQLGRGGERAVSDPRHRRWPTPDQRRVEWTWSTSSSCGTRSRGRSCARGTAGTTMPGTCGTHASSVRPR